MNQNIYCLTLLSHSIPSASSWLPESAALYSFKTWLGEKKKKSLFLLMKNWVSLKCMTNCNNEPARCSSQTWCYSGQFVLSSPTVAAYDGDITSQNTLERTPVAVSVLIKIINNAPLSGPCEGKAVQYTENFIILSMKFTSTWHKAGLAQSFMGPHTSADMTDYCLLVIHTLAIKLWMYFIRCYVP